MLVIMNFDKYINDCKKIKQKLPWEQKSTLLKMA